MGRKTDYTKIAPVYDQRYARSRYDGVEAALRAFVSPAARVLEVGCGTGHWLVELKALGCRPTGLDPSAAMLERARERGLEAELVRGRAERLPFANGSFERIVCINAIHHFEDIARFAAEARRVLAPGGRLMSIALDPSAGRDRWCIYDYFPETLALDLARYPSTASLRERFAQAGFSACETEVVQNLPFERPAREALDRGELAPSVTSQLAILSREEYDAGIARIRAAIDAAAARGEELRLTADLHLYGTYATAP